MIDRRSVLVASATAAMVLAPHPLRAAPLPSARGRDAARYGLRADSEADQTRALQRGDRKSVV